jgi:hypothetical protein
VYRSSNQPDVAGMMSFFLLLLTYSSDRTVVSDAVNSSNMTYSCARTVVPEEEEEEITSFQPHQAD